MYTTAYYSKADWNDTRFLRPDFDKLLLEARAELDQAKRAAMYRDMAIMVRDEGGVILPMFNDFINAMTKNRSEEHTSELQSLMRISYAVFCLKKKKITMTKTRTN